MNIFLHFKKGLEKTSNFLSTRILDSIRTKNINQETLEELEVENKNYFINAGGEEYKYIPCLNDSPSHIEFLVELISKHTQGWHC